MEVDATDATEAAIKARNNDHKLCGDLVDDETQNETQWQVFAGPIRYPLDDTKAIPLDADRIHRSMGIDPLNVASCARTRYLDGGRTPGVCGDPAVVVCSRCKDGFCEAHAVVYKIADKPVCENCLEAFELTDDTQAWEAA